MSGKKILACIAALCLAASMFALAACQGGSQSKYVGVWNATTGEASGVTVDVSQVMDEFSIEFKSDGSAVAKVNGEKGEGSWEETDGGVALKDTSTGDLQFTDDGDKLTVDYSGVKITFEKQA